ncbi:unnamed protein product, partial [marine sediment metagenome]
DDSYMSAKQVIPIIIEQFKPNSIVDIGCGVGSWLKAWEELGIEDYLGIDGDYGDSSSLMIDEKKFMAVDLNTDFHIKDRYDLAECLEVAEHIPGSEAVNFIKKLTEFSDIIMFSAATPYQGGTNHYNENWLEYWAIIFSEFNYVPVDFIRKKIWNNNNIRFWYRQNLILFVKKEKASIFNNDPIFNSSLSVIHPELLLWATSKLKNNLKNINKDIQYYNDIIHCLRESKGHLPTEIKHYNNLIPIKKPNHFIVAIKKLLKYLINT